MFSFFNKNTQIEKDAIKLFESNCDIFFDCSIGIDQINLKPDSIFYVIELATEYYYKNPSISLPETCQNFRSIFHTWIENKNKELALFYW